MRFVFNNRGLRNFEQVRILLGGPIMGERLPHPDVPVIKSSTGLLAMHEDSFMQAHAVEQPCIRCGHCSEACPSHLVPNMLADFCRSDQFDKAERFQLFDCIECGCCSYVCPANVPLVHYFRYGKGQLALQRREQEFAEASRIRSAAREVRLAREAAEKAARRAKGRKRPAPRTAARKEPAKETTAEESAGNKKEAGGPDA
jgi:electron transport complex protein RnfC